MKRVFILGLVLVVGLFLYKNGKELTNQESQEEIKNEVMVVEKEGIKLTFVDPRYGQVPGLNQYGFLVDINLENTGIEEGLLLGGECEVNKGEDREVRRGFFIQLLDKVRVGESWDWTLLITLQEGEQVDRCWYKPLGQEDLAMEVSFKQELMGKIEPDLEDRYLSEEDWQMVLKDSVASLGNPEAPVKIVEFLDYQCPYCKQLNEEVLVKLKNDYIETGKIYWVVRDVSSASHDKAMMGAMMARCAGWLGNYWQMHDMLLENQEDWSMLELLEAEEKMVGYGDKLGVDIRECLADESVKNKVRQNLFVMNKIDLLGTPVIVLNKQVLRGARSYQNYKDIIEAELEKLAI